MGDPLNRTLKERVETAMSDEIALYKTAQDALLTDLLDEITRCHAALEGGVGAIAEERKRQIEQEGWTPEHDDEHGDGQLARAAACYASQASAHARLTYDVTLEGYREAEPNRGVGWPWHHKWWKPKDPRRDLVRAAALIAAEIDRLDRAATSEKPAA